MPTPVPPKPADPVVSVSAPIVAGATDADEADALAAAAARHGAVVVSRHPVGLGRWLLQLALGPGRGQAVGAAGDGPVAGSGASEPMGPPPEAADVVAALRGAGFAVLAGPPTEGHAVVWARRNGPSWFAPGACVCFPWSPVDRAPARLVVEIDPGAGFGAGGHPTTLGLLAGLVDPALVGAPAGAGGLADLSARRVIDVGCGTGVLAIAAALCGAGPVDALDIAPAALDATRANAARNRVADRVHLVDADLARCPGPYDLVLANIHADVLAGMASDLRRLVARPEPRLDRGPESRLDRGPESRLDRGPEPRPDRGPEPRTPGGGPGGTGGHGGLLGVSGLSVAQVSRLEAALAPLRTVHRHHRDDWVTLWFRW